MREKATSWMAPARHTVGATRAPHSSSVPFVPCFTPPPNLCGYCTLASGLKPLAIPHESRTRAWPGARHGMCAFQSPPPAALWGLWPATFHVSLSGRVCVAAAGVAHPRLSSVG